MRIRAELQFEEIDQNTNEKERERKIEDQERWNSFFKRIVATYFSNHTFESFHREFDTVKHRLDCRVPSRGQFKCQQFSNPGSKKSKRKLKDLVLEEEKPEIKDETKQESKEEEVEKKENKPKKKFLKNGCGQSWNSNLCLTKFVCSIDDGDVLVVKLREYGQRCRHCQKRYENPSFKDQVLDIMVYWLLNMILEGIFDVVDPSIAVDPEEMGYYPRRSRYKKVEYDEFGNKVQSEATHNKAMCQACVNSKGCGCESVKKNRKNRSRGRNGRNGGANQF